MQNSRIRQRPVSVIRSRLVPTLLTGLLFASFLSFYVSKVVHLQDHEFLLHRNNPISHSLDEYNPAAAAITRRTGAASEPQQVKAENTKTTSILTKGELIRKLYPNETAIENPPHLADGESTFGACMLVMDDNMRLTEWLAYHFHVLPLRYLIVAVDPRSQTSPTHIFNQWRRRGVYIEEWGDRDFWRSDLKLAPIPDDAALQVKRDRHRGRQKYFYKQCLIRMKEQGRTWVSLHDSDEYLVYNHAGGDRFAAWEASRQARHQLKEPRIVPSQTPPTTAEEGGMIRYIQQERAAGLEYYQSPCIGIPRLMFGADESQIDHAAIHKGVPEALRPLVPQFDTLRYRQHARRNDFTKNALGKVIIDVSRVDIKRSPYFMSLHRPIKSICSAPWHNDWSSGLRINHYLGSWESYSFRDDSRRGGERSWEQWEYKATTIDELTDDNIRPWVSGLVETHGAETATEMLRDAGLPPNYQNADDEAWRLHPDKLKAILEVNESTSTDNKLIAFEEWVRDKYRNNNNNPFSEKNKKER